MNSVDVNRKEGAETVPPSVDQCLAYMEEYGMLANIRRHSCMVAQVATTLWEGLATNGQTALLPPADLVVAGALLHDIAKTRCLEEGCIHALVGEEICRELGYPEIGCIVRDHVVLTTFAGDDYARGVFSATELVYYADKRVMHDQIVDLNGRLAYILDRYGADDPVRKSFITKNFGQCRTLEQHIFARLDFTPDDLEHHIRHDLLALLPPQ